MALYKCVFVFVSAYLLGSLETDISPMTSEACCCCMQLTYITSQVCAAAYSCVYEALHVCNVATKSKDGMTNHSSIISYGTLCAWAMMMPVDNL